MSGLNKGDKVIVWSARKNDWVVDTFEKVCGSGYHFKNEGHLQRRECILPAKLYSLAEELLGESKEIALGDMVTVTQPKSVTYAPLLVGDTVEVVGIDEFPALIVSDERGGLWKLAEEWYSH